MSVSFWLTPYDPKSIGNVSELPRSADDLQIAPEWYAEQMRIRWPEIQFFSTSPDLMALQWDLILPIDNPPAVEGCIGSLHNDGYTISFTGFYKPFILWHRSVIPEKYPLYFWTAYDITRSLHLDLNTTAEDIDMFMDGYSAKDTDTE
jgi:hypothetical protein